ncbi:hypothetical protein [Compostimonas suwonensis]|uniref:Probable replication restart protein PriA n=1 Tax=Compostimonas suwonensis TaxID=1048394 RepID=A0A2M9BYI3_9MICO|nr:hypothetical protein [Compostimonas suwonensis]PJJ63143.1 replication restart DNA helicase PriA [Compostimonas suwonensis]
MSAETVARVLIDSPLPQLDRLFDYAIPEELRAEALPGVRVKVPFRSAGRSAEGYLVELGEPGEEYSGRLSPLESVVSIVPVLSPELWSLARKVADRSAGNASDVLRLAIPPRQVRVEKAFLRDGSAAASAPLPLPLTELDGYGSEVLEAVAGGARLAVAAVPRPVRLDSGESVGHWALTLAQLAADTLARRRSAILAVPDFRDQDQLEAALHTLVPEARILRSDARQANADRYRSFLSALGDEPVVIVGNRSAVYAPAPALGLIALWDDGDPLFSEQLSPYANARDAALIRQESSGAALVLLAHSASIEARRLVQLGWLTVCAPTKVWTPHIVPTAQQAGGDAQFAAARIPSTAWTQAREALAHGPVLVQVARPGYAPALACASCRHSARCGVCQGPLGRRSANAVPACQWCGTLAPSWHCGNCGGTELRTVGVGAGRTAEDLGRAFPGAKVVVADGERPILTIGSEPALIVATRGAEPRAEGGYRAVLLLDGERMLARESLGVDLDCLRLWSNAAALSAPGAPTMLAAVAGPIATALATWRQDQYTDRELADRRTLRFPPAVRVASVTGFPDTVAAAIDALPPSEHLDVLGPVGVDDGLTRAIVRFDYGLGPEVASSLRASVVAAATSRRKPAPGKPAYRTPNTLRVRFDDPEILA